MLTVAVLLRRIDHRKAHDTQSRNLCKKLSRSTLVSCAKYLSRNGRELHSVQYATNVLIDMWSKLNVLIGRQWVAGVLEQFQYLIDDTWQTHITHNSSSKIWLHIEYKNCVKSKSGLIYKCELWTHAVSWVICVLLGGRASGECGASRQIHTATSFHCFVNVYLLWWDL